MVVPALVNFADGCGVDWWQLGFSAHGLAHRAGGSASVSLDGLFSVGLPAFDEGKWTAVRVSAASG